MQMDWIKALVLLVGLAVWVLSTLAKKRQEQKPLRVPQPEPREDDDEAAAPKRRRSASEVDKFLEEVRRRREAMEGRRPSPPPVPVVAQAPPPRRPPPLPAPRPSREDTRRPMPSANMVILRKPDLPRELQREFSSPEEALREIVRIYGAVPNDVQIFQRTEDGLRELPPGEVRRRLGAEKTPAPSDFVQAAPVTSPDTGGATILGPVATSSGLRQALGLLQNRRSLVSAMILQEILQPPVCRRKGGVPAQRK